MSSESTGQLGHSGQEVSPGAKLPVFHCQRQRAIGRGPGIRVPVMATPLTGSHAVSPGHMPTLLTADEVGTLLRTSRKAVYAMVERGQLPGVVKIGRRLLVRSEDLLDWLRQKAAPSLEG